MNVVRAMFILAIVTVAVLASECVFIIATLNEGSNFQEAYESASVVIIDNFYKQVDNLLWNAQGVATTIGVTYHTSLWPNVTISKFPALCESAIALSQASAVSFHPLVSDENRISWEKYASFAFPLTAQNGRRNVTADETIDFFNSGRSWNDGIYQFHNGTSHDAPLEAATGILFPTWQMYPLPRNYSYSDVVGAFFDELSNPVRATAVQSMIDRKGSTMSTFLFQDANNSDVAYHHVPRSILYYPILDIDHGDNTRGMISLQIKWDTMLQGATLDYNETMIVVIDNSCGGIFSYAVQGESASYYGPGQLQNKTVNGNLISAPSSYEQFLSLFNDHGMIPMNTNSSCSYKISVYASQAFKDVFFTYKPNLYRAIVFVSLLMLTGIFIIFDIMVGKHQKKMLDATKQSDAIVRSLFPDAVADRLYDEAREREIQKGKNLTLESKNRQLRSFMKSPTLISESNDEDVLADTTPIAELFTDTTILFADFVGFTAWCSEREPVQVFTLLETVYSAMDKIGRRMNVFKVETIGDCYVAATGLPEPQADHAERMAMFAFKCLIKVKELTKKLESKLGPGTADLGMRMGIHSGPITAGVVRGRNARFQLFGDTMNVASRIESSGKKNKIHLSRDTALLLKPHLVVKREDSVTLKGKGEQQTYWFNFLHRASEGSRSSSNDSYINSSTSCPDVHLDSKWEGTTLGGILGKSKVDSTTERLVSWNVDILKPMLGKLIAKRTLTASQIEQLTIVTENETLKHEVQVVINMEKFDAAIHSSIFQTNTLVPEEVDSELRLYIATIASGYPENPFHSFEHCSHVVMSASKLMKRILASEEMKEKTNEDITLQHLHEHTFGIATDPLCQFAVVFSALVHDVGHPGVPNARLAMEDPVTAEKYENRSIAEQRSLDVAFDLLKLPTFQNLRKCIYATDEECTRFRRLVVNCILATDIADNDMKLLRDHRWNTAFHLHDDSTIIDDWMDRKATITIEHIIQASDVAHTMQHFIIYQRWNERLYQELYFAYLAGRMEKDPTFGWYAGELWFFDNYIIPLAKKLKECGVFGVSSDEYLHYASQNRYEWEQKGHQIVQEMKERADAVKAKERNRNHAASSKGSSIQDASKNSSNSVVMEV